MRYLDAVRRYVTDALEEGSSPDVLLLEMEPEQIEAMPLDVLFSPRKKDDAGSRAPGRRGEAPSPEDVEMEEGPTSSLRALQIGEKERLSGASEMEE